MSTGEEFALNLHDRVKRLEEALLPAHLLEEVQAHPAYAPPFGTETAEPPADPSVVGGTPDPTPSDPPAAEPAAPTMETAEGPSSSY